MKFKKMCFLTTAAISFALCVVMVARGATEKQTNVITVSEKPVIQDLYYSGTIKPLTNMAVTTSESGTIETLHFQYGQHVKTGQLLFTVDSEKFQSTLVTDIKTYLSAKRQLSESKSKLASSKDLLKYGLIARNQYVSDETTYYNDELAYLQAEQTLVELLDKHKSIKLDFRSLRLSDIGKLKNILDVQTQSVIKVYSPASGIALLPTANANQGLASTSGATASGPVVVGSAVQKDQAVLTIGDLTGAAIDISVNEVSINYVKPGQVAIITSMAFPGITLKGKVVSVGSQAKSGSTGIPSFPVSIIIPKLSKSVQAVMRVGMSAKVQLVIKEAPKVQIPMQAVIQKGAMSFVKLKTKNGIKEVPVITGSTSQSDVVIRSGLKTGDQIVLPD